MSANEKPIITLLRASSSTSLLRSTPGQKAYANSQVRIADQPDAWSIMIDVCSG